MRSFLQLPVVAPFVIIIALVAGAHVEALHAQSIQVVINEVHYHPGDDGRSGEFVELHNFGDDEADVGSWLLYGGITFVIPRGTVIPAGGFLVVAKNDVLIMDRYDLPVGSVVGDFDGSLENGGEEIRLFTDGGYLISFIDYGDTDPWPETPDGLGPSLERRSPLHEDADPSAWAASIYVGGSPGRMNSVGVDEGTPPVGDGTEIIPQGSRWRFFRGVSEPPANWNDIGFNDTGWEEDVAGFGYDDGDDATLLLDMLGNYTSVYVRHEFQLPSVQSAVALQLDVSYDDGYIAYLNGVEVARGNVAGPAGVPIPFDGTAAQTVGPAQLDQVDLLAFADALVSGTNVIAVHGLNGFSGSADFSLHPWLTGEISATEGGPIDFIEEGDTWSYLRGENAPPAAWNEHDFDDNGWDRGPSGFGYGDQDDATVLDDMSGNYITVYARKRFVVSDRQLVESLDLVIDYDDGFVAYINGVEIARGNVADDGYDEPANGSHEAGSPETFAIADPSLTLRDGVNVLAVVGHNATIGSSDFSLAPALSGVLLQDDDDPPPPPEEDNSRAPRDLVINEIAPAGAGTGWVELFNPTSVAINASGRRLSVFPGENDDFALPDGTIVAARGFLVFDENDLGFELDAIPALILSTAGGRYIDGFNPRTIDASHSSGRFPDGDTSRYVFTSPTPGTTNEVALEDRVVINEIMYHPSDANSGGEYIEIYNRSGTSVDIAGWSFTRGISFAFPAGSTISAGSFLVIARDPQAMIDAYGLAASRVFGPYVGGLDNDAETLLLRDNLSNPVDRVRFADEGSWPESPDGEGPSAELVHAGLDNRYGPAWEASEDGGSPGEVNARRTSNPDPIIVGVSHSPVIPTSDDTVRVLASISDEDPISSATLFWEVDDSGGNPSQVTMRDDGVQDDGVANNGIYGGDIPPRSNADIIAFWIRATAPGGQSVRVPTGAPTPAFLYRIEDAPPESPRPLYRMILRDDDYRRFLNRARGSNELIDTTFVANGRAYYNRGLRLRGSSARSCDPLSYRIQFDHDRDLHGIKRLNINGCNIHQQWIGYDFLRRTGIATPTVWFRKLSFNGNTRGDLHLRVEAIDDRFLSHVFPTDDSGNLYRGEGRANLDYRGDDPDDYRRNYPKLTNENEDDYSDLIDLCYRLNTGTTPDEDYPEIIEATVDVHEWSLYFAAFAFLGSTEGSLLLDRGDDYFIYHRFSDDRWVLLPWDLDSCFDDENQRLFRPTVDGIERFLEHERYAPDYWCHLEWILDNIFRPDLMDARIDHLAPLVVRNRVNALRNFAAARYEFILDRLRRDIVVTQVSGGNLCDGTIEATRSTLSLDGRVPGCRTTEVRVNDVTANFDQLTSTWSATVNVGDATTLEISTWDRRGLLVNSLRIPYANVSSPTALTATISSDMTLRKSQSPYRAANNVTVQPGATLEIEPGTVVLFDDDATLRVRGRVLALGTEEDPVLLRSDDCGSDWEGIVFLSGSTGSRLEHCLISGATRAEGTSASVTVDGADVTLEHTSIDAESNTALLVRAGGTIDLVGGSVTSRRDGIIFESTGGTIDSCRFEGVPGTAVHADGESARDVRVEWSIFDSCGVAITVTDGAHAELSHLTIYNNSTGLTLRQDNAGAGSGTARADSVIIWATALPIFTLSPIDLDISHSDTSSNPPPGDGNISTDPAFVDPDGGDFRLLSASPCRRSGLDETDMGAIPYAPFGDARGFVRCDANADGTGDVSDAVHTLLYLFGGGAEADCAASADCNSDTDVNVSDVIFALAHLFNGGETPQAPFPACDEELVSECAIDTCFQ